MSRRPRLVLLEPNARDRECLARLLESRGFQVLGLRAAALADVAWIRSNRGLTKNLRTLRSLGFTAPVLASTATPTATEVVPLHLPTSLAEIEAAIRSLLPRHIRRLAPMRDPYGFGIDDAALTVLLTNTERMIVLPILAAEGEMVARTAIEERVFALRNVPGREKRKTPLDSHMNVLRPKLAIVGIEIVAMRGRGLSARQFRD